MFFSLNVSLMVQVYGTNFSGIEVGELCDALEECFAKPVNTGIDRAYITCKIRD